MLDLSGKDGGYSALKTIFYDVLATRSSTRLGSYLVQVVGAPGSADLKILDVGSGGGQLIEQIVSKSELVRCVGIDASGPQVKKAISRCSSYGDRVEFVEASALSIPFNDGEFDLVLSVGSLKHWPDQRKGLEECSRVLKPGGMLAICELSKEFDAAAIVNLFLIPNALSPLVNLLKPLWSFGMRNGLAKEDCMSLTAGLSLANVSVMTSDVYPANIISGIK